MKVYALLASTEIFHLTFLCIRLDNIRTNYSNVNHLTGQSIIYCGKKGLKCLCMLIAQKLTLQQLQQKTF